MKHGDLLNDLKYIWLNFETSLFSKTTNFTGVRQTFPCIFHVSEGKQLREKIRFVLQAINTGTFKNL